MNPLAYIELAPQGTADASVIWLHGLGASGNDFQPIVPELHLPAELKVRFIFPHAPEQAVTVNGGHAMPSWYDILSMESSGRSINQEQLQTSVANVRHVVEQEIQRGIAPERIILAGFSQGGAVAYHVALTHPVALGGLMALSTYMPLAEALPAQAQHPDLPIFVMHGTQDPVVPEGLGKEALSTLDKMGYTYRYESYPMEHQVCLEQIRDIGKWLGGVLVTGEAF